MLNNAEDDDYFGCDVMQTSWAVWLFPDLVLVFEVHLVNIIPRT